MLKPLFEDSKNGLLMNYSGIRFSIKGFQFQSDTELECKGLKDSDIPELEGMILALYDEDSLGQPITIQKIQGTIKKLRNSPDRGNILIFKCGSVVVGYAILVNYWSNEYGGEILFIDELYVKKEWRSLGISSNFIKHLILSVPPIVKALQLEVSKTNDQAMQFYKTLGFKPCTNRLMIQVL